MTATTAVAMGVPLLVELKLAGLAQAEPLYSKILAKTFVEMEKS